MDAESQPLQSKRKPPVDRRVLMRNSHTLSSAKLPSHHFLDLENATKEEASAHRAVQELFLLTAAFFVSSVSWVAMKATDTALLGHVGTKYLDASAYSDLYTSSTGVFIQGQVLGVFCSQAYGAGMSLSPSYLSFSRPADGMQCTFIRRQLRPGWDMAQGKLRCARYSRHPGYGSMVGD